VVSGAPTFDHATLEAAPELAANRGVKTVQLFMSLRVASTFRTFSPPLFETMEALGRERGAGTTRRRKRPLQIEAGVSGPRTSSGPSVSENQGRGLKSTST